MSYDLVGNIMAYENGSLSEREEVMLFSRLVASGMAWTLQGHYGRMAARYIEAGILSAGGAINWSMFDSVDEGGEG